MPRPMGTPRDLSQQTGNPTSELQKNYQQLMTIQDPEELAQAAIGVVQPLVGTGMSQMNYKKFMRDLQGATRRGLTGLQKYLTNYILSGSGLGVARGGGGMRESAEIAGIASVITEDVDIFNELTSQQQRLKNLVESCTDFAVILL